MPALAIRLDRKRSSVKGFFFYSSSPVVTEMIRATVLATPRVLCFSNVHFVCGTYPWKQVFMNGTNRRVSFSNFILLSLQFFVTRG